MTRTFSVKSLFDTLDLDSLNGFDQVEYDSISLNSSKEKESPKESKKITGNDTFFSQLIEFIISEDSRSKGATDNQHTTEHNFERFRIHSQGNSDASSVIPKPVRTHSFIVEKERLLAKIRICYFEAGILSEADYYFKDLVKKYGSIEYPLSLLSDITNHNINNEHILEGVLHILSNCDYSSINPVWISIVLAAAVNHSPVIQDLLISCFESWDSPDGIDILENLELDTPWINTYRNEVVSQLKANNISA